MTPAPLKEGPAQLTRREIEVLAHIGAGHSNSQVADALHLSINTVKTYVRTSYAKIGATTRTHAVLFWLDHGPALLAGLNEPVVVRPPEAKSRASSQRKNGAPSGKARSATADPADASAGGLTERRHLQTTPPRPRATRPPSSAADRSQYPPLEMAWRARLEEARRTGSWVIDVLEPGPARHTPNLLRLAHEFAVADRRPIRVETTFAGDGSALIRMAWGPAPG